MRTTDLRQVIDEALGTPGGFFPASSYRLAVYFLAPTPQEIEQFQKQSLYRSIEAMTRCLQSQSSADADQLIGPSGSLVREGLRQIVAASPILIGATQVEGATHWAKTVLLDTVESECNRLEASLRSLRHAASRKLESMPDRLQKARALAEEAMYHALLDGESDRHHWLREAESRIEEVLEQPVGQRDPFSWLLQGYLLHLRDRNIDSGQAAMLQACLASGKEHDAVFLEAIRTLAHFQARNGAFEAAFQTFQRANGAIPECMEAEALIYAAGANRGDEMRILAANLASRWPIGLVGIYGHELALEHGATFRGALDESSRFIVQNAKTGLQQWEQLAERLQVRLTAIDENLELPVAITSAQSYLTDVLEQPDLFTASWTIAESDRGRQDTIAATAQLARTALTQLQTEMSELGRTVEKVKEWREQMIEGIRQSRTHQEYAERRRLGLTKDEDKAQAGCMMGSSVGCMGFAAYFVACFASAGIASAWGPNTSNGRWIMAGIALPIVLGIALAFIDSVRRSVSQMELNRSISTLNQEQKNAIDQVQEQYMAQMEPLTDRTRELKARIEKTESIVRQFTEDVAQIQREQAA